MANDHDNLFPAIVAGLLVGIGLIVLFAMIFALPEQHAPISSYLLTVGNKTYEIPYHFSSELGKINSMEADPRVLTISISVSVLNDTTLEIRLPIEMLKQLEVSGYVVTEELVVFVDDVPGDVAWQYTDEEQIATITLEQGTESIDIVGSIPL